MKKSTISEISREMSISTRTLRYYEQIGLIQSVKQADYAYRCYDEATVKRLQQILVLRKLRISLRQIGLILQSESMQELIEAFRQNLSELDDEITALSTIRDIIGTFLARLNEQMQLAAPGMDVSLNLLDDSALLEAVDALMVPAKHPRFSMGFDVAHNDKEMRECFAFYQEAFDAVKLDEFTPPVPSWTICISLWKSTASRCCCTRSRTARSSFSTAACGHTTTRQT